MSWHDKPVDEILRELDTGREGLSSAEAKRRLQVYGENRIREQKRLSPVRILAAQFNDFLIYLLVAAAALSVLVGFLPGNEVDYTEAVLILGIVVANGLFGFAQDYRAESAMQALRDLSTPEAFVLRDGARVQVPATATVPGDVIILEQGARIPADARIFQSFSLETVEAALTGESGGVEKSADPVAAEVPLAERSSMVFMNTDVVQGRAKAVVVCTGMQTEMGAVATALEETQETATPFQREVNKLGKQITWAALSLIVMVGIVEYLFTSAGIVTTLMVAITLAVAAVPESLPAVVTLTLAMGSRKLARQNALVRRLSVVESLGAVDVIVTDKTGTLTESQMIVQRVYFSGTVYEVTGDGAQAKGEFRLDGSSIDGRSLAPLLRCGAIVNDAELLTDHGAKKYHGSPTEIALLTSAAKAGISTEGERIREIPFSSDRKRMTVVLKGEPPKAYMKGASEYVLDRCDRILCNGQIELLDDVQRETILSLNTEFAESAYRVLGFAEKELPNVDADNDHVESGMVFLGLQAMIDPPREEVPEAIAECRRAGIRVVMVTGDNVSTAKAIGRQIGFDTSGALTGNDLDRISDAEIHKTLARTEIFARVSPHHKLRLLQALQHAGHRVAMTGDGVNDAPALRAADVGVAMGMRGTEVARQASDMVLRDDNFATLKNAIEEGRGIFDNIRKFIAFLLSANAGEILVVFTGITAGRIFFPSLFTGSEAVVILTPAMLLWVNVVTDGLPALALGVDPKMPGIMQRPPRPNSEAVIDRGVIFQIGIIAVGMTLTGLPLYFRFLTTSRDTALAQTLLFTLMVLSEMIALQAIRSRYKLPVFSNRWLVWAVLSSLMLQAVVLYSPLRHPFGVASLGKVEWIWLLAASLIFTAIVGRMGKWGRKWGQ